MPRVSSKDKYTQQVFELFKQRGLTLNMEEIAYELGLTKKTLYNNYNSKQELIGTVVTHFYANLEKEVQQATLNSDNAIDAFFAVSVIISNEVNKLGHVFLKDISLYSSSLNLSKFTERSNFYSILVMRNLQMGIEQGLYREDLNMEYTTLFYTSAIALFYKWDKDGFKYFEDAVNYHKELVKYHLQSVVNEKGYQILLNYL